MNATAQPMIRLDSIEKRYPNGSLAVRSLSLDVAVGDIVMLVGPSGCGKTTTLKMINRLIEPTSGRIMLDGEDVTHVDPVQLRRRMGYVIQNVGLFPHRTIEQNIATVPSLIGWDRKRARARASELLELVGLAPDEFAKRYPSQLSGGQRQRVGVARALAADPPVLLMDEPFSAIDPIARDRLQLEFLRLQQEVRKTIVFVTHDIEEAIRVGDKICVLSNGGVVEQYADPATLLGTPANDFVANFVGSDRGLKRLAVTRVSEADLEHPPTVRMNQSAAQARAILEVEGARWAVVVDDAGDLHGWVSREHLERLDQSGSVESGQVSEYAHRMEAWVPANATLKQAFSEMLQHDAGWVAVLNGDHLEGVLTPESLHAALRRSVDEAEPETAGAV
ncbi:MAG: opuCA [Frankiales bacterium]|nr:opuCA [Frankiales bacterium]